MSRIKPIQLSIPSPCSQSWDEMTPSGNSRYCLHCAKTVIDFTTWSDEAMHRFFTTRTEQVCGRFYATQLGRPLNIPYQPHSRLYQVVAALGLTLLFTRPDAQAQPRPTISVRDSSVTPKKDSGLCTAAAHIHDTLSANAVTGWASSPQVDWNTPQAVTTGSVAMPFQDVTKMIWVTTTPSKKHKPKHKKPPHK